MIICAITATNQSYTLSMPYYKGSSSGNGDKMDLVDRVAGTEHDFSDRIEDSDLSSLLLPLLLLYSTGSALTLLPSPWRLHPRPNLRPHHQVSSSSSSNNKRGGPDIDAPI